MVLLLINLLRIATTSAAADVVVEPGVISTAAAEVRIAFRPDGRQILWGSIGRGGEHEQQDIWEKHRVGNGWSEPARVAFDTDAVEFDPSFSPDGRTLYFHSDRAGGFGGTDIYSVAVGAATFRFGEPTNLGANVNSAGDEWAPTATRTGTLIFASDGWGGFGRHDLFEATLGASTTTPRNLGAAVNGPDDDFDAALSPDGNALIFSSGTMADDHENVHLFRAHRASAGWSTREPLPIGCSEFSIGASLTALHPGALFYSARCDDGLGRMDIRKAFLPLPEHRDKR